MTDKEIRNSLWIRLSYLLKNNYPICKEWRLKKNTFPQTKNIRDYNSKILDNFVEWSLETGWELHLCLKRIKDNKPYSSTNCKWVTQAEHTRITMNKTWKDREKSSKFIGVTRDKEERKKRWRAQINQQGNILYIGHYVTELDAAKAYNTYVENNKLDNQLNVFTKKQLQTPITVVKRNINCKVAI